MTRSFYAFLLLILFSVSAKAQRAPYDGGGVDYERLHFGFTFQYVASECKIYKTENWKDSYQTPEGIPVTPALFSVSSPVTPGFALGFVSDLRAGTHTNLRFTPVLTFGERKLEYSYNGRTDLDPFPKQIKAVLVELPLGFKLKSDKIGNFRAYILGGAKYSMNIKSNKSDEIGDGNEIEKLVKNKKNYLSYEAGIGFDLYLEYFKLSPEIKFSQSVGSILERDEPNAFNQPLDKLFLRSFQFSLYFE